MPTYKYALRPAEGGKWTKGTLIDSIEWEDEKQAKEGLEKQFPGNKVYVKMFNKNPEIKWEPGKQEAYKKGITEVNKILNKASVFKQCLNCGADLPLKRRLKNCEKCTKELQKRN